jgi:Mg/Co/Ni transporter MgtE
MDEPARLTESIKELLGAGRTDRLADLLEEAHAADVATALREQPLAEQVQLFRLLAPLHAGQVLSELDDATRTELVRALDELEISRILDGMPSDHVVAVVEELPREEAD